MNGYKVFVENMFRDEVSPRVWEGPWHSLPFEWEVRQGAILVNKEGVDLSDTECGFGINFYTRKKDAISLASAKSHYPRYTCVYSVETLPDSTVVIPFDREDSKMRTNKLRLLKRIAVYRGGKQVKRAKLR